MFRLPCPSCGGTTSFAHFVRGEWRSSFQANAAVCVFALLISMLAPWLTVSAVTGRLIGIASPGWVFVYLTTALTCLTLANWMIHLLFALR